MKLPHTGPYTAKDQIKADRANKFIGRGCMNSSTYHYAKAYGDKANCSSYTASDTVFISANGNRPNALLPNTAEIQLAINAKATLLTDIAADRARSYNIGERHIADYLRNNGYSEKSAGVWKPT